MVIGFQMDIIETFWSLIQEDIPEPFEPNMDEYISMKLVKPRVIVGGFVPNVG